MKEGSSRKRKIIGLLGLMAIALAGISFLAIGAGFARGNMSSDIEVREEFSGEFAEIRAQHFSSENADGAQFGYHADYDHSEHGQHGRHGRGRHGSFGMLGMMIGGLIHLTTLGLASFGIYSLYKRWTTTAPAAPQARVINEDDDSDIDENIKVG